MRKTFLIWLLAWALAVADEGTTYTMQFRTWPSRDVTVSLDGQDYNSTQVIPVTYHDHENEKPIRFQRPGFATKKIELKSEDANAANKNFFPPIGQEVISLQAESPWVALQAWEQEHPMQALVAAAGLLLVLPAVLFRAWQGWRTQRHISGRIAGYEAARDRGDSMLMTRLEGYLLVSRLGQGGMATVYKGLPEGSLDESAPVAVKVLGRELFANTEFQIRFRREVAAYQKLEHPNIVKVISWRELDNSGEAPYIVLEFVPGRTLSSLIPGEGMSWSEARPLLEQIFSAVTYAHSQGVVHRDLKPDNVMVSDGRVKVMDFGLARSDDASHLTATGAILGTPAYMAPEQLSQGSSQPAVDQYALGAVTYRMLCGHLPHESEGMMQLFNKVLTAAPVPLRTYNPKISKEIEAVVMKMLHRGPDSRYATVGQAWAELQRAGQAC